MRKEAFTLVLKALIRSRRQPGLPLTRGRLELVQPLMACMVRV